MYRKYNRRGFTLIEMLIIIAIVAMLVAIVLPIAAKAPKKAQAAADAANLRAVLGALNVDVLSGGKTVSDILAETEHPTSKMDPDATLRVVYSAPGFIDVYYVNQSTGTYYGLEYLSDVATNGTSSLSTDTPAVPSGSVWYEAGVGEITD